MNSDFNKTISEMDKLKTKKTKNRTMEEQIALLNTAKNNVKDKESELLLLKPTNLDRSMAMFIDLFCAMILSAILTPLFQHSLDRYIMQTLNMGFNGLDAQAGGSLGEADSMSMLYPILHGFYLVFFMVVILGIFGFFTGYTPGTRFYKFNVYDYKTKEIVTLTRRTMRAALFMLDMMFMFGLGSLSGFFNAEGRTIEDKICKTILLKEKK